MKTNSTSTDSNTNSQTISTTTSTGYEVPPTVDDKPAVDDFGYDVDSATPPAPSDETHPADDKPADEKPVDDKVVDPATGYNDPATPPADDKPADEKPVDEFEKNKKEISEVLKDLPEGYDKDKVTEFALKNKLTKEQVTAYAEMTKQEATELARRQEEALKTQRASWVNELKNDPEFGGEQFARNVDKVEKILAKYMPDTKKVLTERKGMLPPTLMKDLRKVYDALNPVTNFVHGEANTPKEEKHFLDELYN